MSITLHVFTDTNKGGEAITFDPKDNATFVYNGNKYVQFVDIRNIPDDDIIDKTDPMKPFYLKSIDNNTDYYIVVSGPLTLEMFFGSVSDTKLRTEILDSNNQVVQTVDRHLNLV